MQDKKHDIPTLIREAVTAGLAAGRISAAQSTTDAYKATERRLYAYPILLKKIKDDTARMEEIIQQGGQAKSKDIVRFSRAGVRLTPEEILEALTQNMIATIESDQYEVDTIKGALSTIKDDPYYKAVSWKYISGADDQAIANSIPCESVTVRKHRGRLVRQLAVYLYGVQAL